MKKPTRPEIPFLCMDDAFLHSIKITDQFSSSSFPIDKVLMDFRLYCERDDEEIELCQVFAY